MQKTIVVKNAKACPRGAVGMAPAYAPNFSNRPAFAKASVIRCFDSI